jgi:hypothetical protein
LITTPLTKKIIVNDRPVASIATVNTVCVGDEVKFDGSLSIDPDGEVSSFDWDLGDGQTAQGAQISHAFTAPGLYSVRLRVDDGVGTICSQAEHTVQFKVNAPPQAIAGDDFGLKIGGSVDSLMLSAAQSNDPDGDPLEHYWEMSNGEILDGERIRLDQLEPGVLNVTLTSSDPHGLACSTSTDTISVNISQRPPTEPVSE